MSKFHNLVEQEIPRLRRYARALTRNADRADDLVQDTLLRAVAKAHLWQPGTDLRAWLFTVMHNQHINAVRREMRRQHCRHRPDAILAGCYNGPDRLAAATRTR